MEEKVNQEELDSLFNVLDHPYKGQSKVEWYEEHRKNPDEESEMMYLPKYPTIENLVSPTRELVDQMGNFSVVEYTMRFDHINDNNPNLEYFQSLSGIRRRQIVINLEDYFYAKIKPGSLNLSSGDIGNKMLVNGIFDYLKKKIKEWFIKDRVIYELFYGHGQLLLEYTERFIVMIDCEKYGKEGLIIEPYLLLACDNDVKIETIILGKPLTRYIKKQKMIVNRLTGKGVVAFKSDIPKGQLLEIELNNEEIRIDGYSAVCYSKSLKYHAEFAQKGHYWFTKMTKDSTLVNVFRGTGRVLLSPVAQSAYSKKTNVKIKSLDE